MGKSDSLLVVFARTVMERADSSIVDLQGRIEDAELDRSEAMEEMMKIEMYLSNAYGIILAHHTLARVAEKEIE